MIEYYEDGRINVNTLSQDKVLSERIINSYDYIKLKNDFERVVDLLLMNELTHQLYKEQLKFNIDDQLQFIISFDDSNYNKTRTEVITFSRQYYDNSTKACMFLLVKVKEAWSYLNDYERFIIKSLEFDEPHKTDEDIKEELLLYKNRYIQIKKSAYIKLSTILKLNKTEIDPEEKQRELYTYITWYNDHREEMS